MRRAKAKKIYLIGALANPEIPFIGNRLRKLGFEVFDQWWAVGPLADSYLKQYARIRGLDYKELLRDEAAKTIYDFDKRHIDDCDIAVMAMKCGRSAHLELGYVIGQGKPGYILFDSVPSRVDIMYQFATEIFFSEKELHAALRKNSSRC